MFAYNLADLMASVCSWVVFKSSSCLTASTHRLAFDKVDDGFVATNDAQQTEQRRVTTISKRSHAIARGYRSGLGKKRASKSKTQVCRLSTKQTKSNTPGRNVRLNTQISSCHRKMVAFYVETKGIWSVEDRQKWHLVTQQHPDVDFRRCSAT